MKRKVCSCEGVPEEICIGLENLDGAELAFECHAGFMVKTKQGVYVHISPSDFITVKEIDEYGRPIDHSVRVTGVHEKMTHLLVRNE